MYASLMYMLNSSTTHENFTFCCFRRGTLHGSFYKQLRQALQYVQQQNAEEEEEEEYPSLTAHQHQKGHTVPKQV